ncbi:MAG: IS110 family transposase [Anaerolineae bacterium]
MLRRSSDTSTLAQLPKVHLDAAGLDIGSTEIWAAVPADRDGESVRQFGTFTPDLQALADWLVACHIQTVALESTGVYWIPIYEILEARGLEVRVVNAQHLKRVPGRKSDFADCQWLQYLHTVGLLNGSFRPEGEMCVLRAYLRQRATLIEHRAAHILHMQKALQQMNVQLTQVLSDITGVTGMAIIRAIVAGERDAVKLAQLRDKRCAHAEDEIAKALTGNYRAEHVFALKQALALYDAYTQQIQDCDAAIEQQMQAMADDNDDDLPPLDDTDKRNSHSKNGPSYDARTLLYRLAGVDLVAVTGLSALTVQTIISEVGLDMSRFPNEKHFCSWLGLAPHNDVSGGRVLRSRTLPTRSRAGQAFRLAAQSASRSHDTEFGAYYRRIRGRLGPKQALVALAHKIARTVYYLLKHRTPFHDVGAMAFERSAKERDIARLEKWAAKLGRQVVEIAAPT